MSTLTIKNMDPNSDILSFSYYELTNGQYEVRGFDPNEDVLVLEGLTSAPGSTVGGNTLDDLRGDVFDGNMISVQLNPFEPSIVAGFGLGGGGYVAINIMGVTDASEIDVVLA